ncbi:restriction endonuclease subunit S [Ligilactobacillus salivarius]|uniref:restriction endonuclease subunit S n=1 Tax=Ligilactobacillus salivarius TaxID=1624 RepID=UPI003F8981FD
MAKEEKKAPKLRFNGYTNDWERKELNNILKINSGRDYKQLNSGSIPVYGTGGYMLSVNDKLSDTDAVGIGRKGTIDKPLYLKAPFWTVDTLFYCTSKENSDVKFIYLLFQIINWKRYDESTGVPSLSKNTISNIKTYVPKIKEQDYISKLFFSLDNTLQLHERKYEELTLIKKALLQKLFPKKDGFKPEVRYKNFNDAWEQRKLGEVVERRIEKRRQSERYPRLAFASGQGVIPLSERKTNNREQLTKDEFTKKYLVTELDDIVYNPANVKYGAIDRNKYGRGLISPIYVTFTTEEVPGFIERIVKSHDFKQKALRFEEGTVTKRQSVNPEDLVTINILVASQKKEQKKISLFFDNIDTFIALHRRKLEKLKQLKKFLLQNMFI